MVYNNSHFLFLFFYDYLSRILHIESKVKILLSPIIKHTIFVFFLRRELALDWVARRVYVTDSSRILVADLRGEFNYTVVDGNLENPRDIVVAPIDGLMFWVDWGADSRIERADMDGYHRTVLVHNLLWPTSLAIDYPAKRLYWADPKSARIESIRFDGKGRHLVRQFNDSMRPFKLEVFEDDVFVATYRKHDVFRMNKFGKGEVTFLAHNLAR